MSQVFLKQTLARGNIYDRSLAVYAVHAVNFLGYRMRISIIRGNVSVFFADLAVQIRYVHYNICCFILLFYLRAYVNAEMARLRVLSL